MALPQDETDLQDPMLPKKRQTGGFPDPSQFGDEFTAQPAGSGFLGSAPMPKYGFDSGSTGATTLPAQQPTGTPDMPMIPAITDRGPSGTIPAIGGQGDPNFARTGGIGFSGGTDPGFGDWQRREDALNGKQPFQNPFQSDPTGDALMKGLTAPAASGQPSGAPSQASGLTGRDWFMNWTQGKSPSKETLLQNEAELKAHGYTLVPNATMGPDGKPTNYDVRDPNGRIVDAIVGGSNPNGGSAWQYDDSGGGPAAGGSGGGGYGQSSFSGGGYGDAIHDALLRLLGRGEGTVNANDPLIAGATGAYRQQADRSLRHSRNMLAERAAAEGLNSGGEGSGSFDSALQSQQEQEGRDVGSFQSGLMLDENKQRRGDVMNALQAMLSQYGLGQQNQQFYDTMGYNMGRDEMQQNYLYNALLGGG